MENHAIIQRHSHVVNARFLKEWELRDVGIRAIIQKYRLVAGERSWMVNRIVSIKKIIL